MKKEDIEFDEGLILTTEEGLKKLTHSHAPAWECILELE